MSASWLCFAKRFFDYDSRYQYNLEYAIGLKSYVYDNHIDEPYTVYSGPYTLFTILEEFDSSRNIIFNHYAHAYMYNIIHESDLLIDV